MGGEGAHLLERAVVEQQGEPLARGQLAARVLGRDPLGPATLERPRAHGAQGVEMLRHASKRAPAGRVPANGRSARARRRGWRGSARAPRRPGRVRTAPGRSAPVDDRVTRGMVAASRRCAPARPRRHAGSASIPHASRRTGIIEGVTFMLLARRRPGDRLRLHQRLPRHRERDRHLRRHAGAPPAVRAAHGGRVQLHRRVRRDRGRQDDRRRPRRRADHHAGRGRPRCSARSPGT